MRAGDRLNLVIAIMSSTYASISDQANRRYLFDLYEIHEEFSRRSVAAPWPLNVPLFIFDMINYRRQLELVKEIWGEIPSFDSYLRRNMTLENLLLHKVLCVTVLYLVARAVQMIR